MARLAPCLMALRSEFNAMAPGRDKGSDGWIADAAHVAAGTSDHIPDGDGVVHAIDVDKDLRRSDFSMERAVQLVVARQRGGKDDRLSYVIYNRRIWSRAHSWVQRAYTGSNAHTEHGHFSARYTTAQESDTRPWGLLEADDVALTEAEKTWIKGLIEAQPVKVWTGVSWNGETAAERLAKAASVAGAVAELDVQMDAYAAADADRDADLPMQVRQALAAGQPPEQVAATLKQISGIDWDAVAQAILASR